MLESVQGEVSRAEVLAILAVTARLQNIIQEKVSSLAHDLVEERRASGNKSLPFIEGHARIHQIELPLDDPLQDHGLNEQTFQEMLMNYEKDEEVMTNVALAMRPPSRGKTGERILKERFQMFTERRWQELIRAAGESGRGALAPQRPSCPEAVKQALLDQAVSLVRKGRLSEARQRLTAAQLAPGTQATLEELRNEERRPRVLQQPFDQETA